MDFLFNRDFEDIVYLFENAIELDKKLHSPHCSFVANFLHFIMI